MFSTYGGVLVFEKHARQNGRRELRRAFDRFKENYKEVHEFHIKREWNNLVDLKSTLKVLQQDLDRTAKENASFKINTEVTETKQQVKPEKVPKLKLENCKASKKIKFS